MEEFGATGEQSWLSSCAAAFTAHNITTGLVDRNGNPMSTFTNNTGGVTVQACYEVCGPNVMYQSFNYTTFSSSFTNWLLPWLALTAQLPYEASGPGTNVMSGVMAVGSPALLTYSLSLTILNRFWIRRRFAKLKKDSHTVSEWAPHVSERISAAGDLLQDAQHAPLRVSQEDGWLSSLIVLRRNQTFWDTVKKDLGNTRRGFTASLFAQMFLAAIAYLFTIISSFIGDIGDKVVALQIAAGSIWIWMIPVILGWILVSTQSRAGAINDALQDDHHETYRALKDPDSDGNVIVEDRQRGILNRSGLNPTPPREEFNVPTSPKDGPGGQRDLHDDDMSMHSLMGHDCYTAVDDFDYLTIPGWYGFNISGDEREEGPIYNYSRIFTWFQSATQIERGFTVMLRNLRQNSSHRKQVNKAPWNNPTTSEAGEQDRLLGTSLEVAEYCGLSRSNMDAYLPWSVVPARVWHHILFSAVVALFVQWGTTGPAILIAYLTPAAGLGCRSGSYVLYGTAATFSFMLLVGSSLLSHAAMLRYQDLQSTRPYGGIQEPRKFGHSVLCGFAVCTRILGKFIAVANAVWLLLFSLLEYIGAFENCWCDANVIGLRSRGWVAIFMTASDISSVAAGYWAGGLAFSLMVCGLSLIFFWLGSGDALEGGE